MDRQTGEYHRCHDLQSAACGDCTRPGAILDRSVLRDRVKHIYVVAKCPVCVAVGADSTGQGDLLGLLVGYGSDSPCPHGQEDKGCADCLWR